MSLLLFATESQEQLPDTVFQSLLRHLPVPLRKKTMSFRRWQDAHNSLFGKLLLLLALRKAGFSPDLEQLQYTGFNKPYLPSTPDFSIAHSGNRVVCIVSTLGRVGIDIETIDNIAFEDFQTQFTPDEWEAIRRSSSPVATFYRFWTAKESLIKADGRGLGIPLQELDVSEARNFVLDDTHWTIHSLSSFNGYACHIALETTASAAIDLPMIDIHRLTPAEIAGEFQPGL